jgi:hypothetical protein
VRGDEAEGRSYPRRRGPLAGQREAVARILAPSIDRRSTPRCFLRTEEDDDLHWSAQSGTEPDLLTGLC